MRLFQVALIGTLFTSVCNLQAVAVEHQEARDNCLKEAQESYDQCIDLGKQMGAETDRTNEATQGNELLHGKCMAQFKEDQERCRVNHPDAK